MKRGFASAFRLWLVIAPILVAFGVIGTRLYFLHVVQSADLIAQVEETRKGVQILLPRRGDILDASGTILSTSRSMVSIGVDPQSVRETDSPKVPELARILGLPLFEVNRAIATKTQPRKNGEGHRIIRWSPLGEPVDEATYDRIQELGIHGVYGNRMFRRMYPGGSLAAHVIGFVNHEGVAAMGVEKQLDFFLRGQEGWREIERDGRRRELPRFRTQEVTPADGYNVVLSIDSVVQHFIEEEMLSIVDRFDPVGATIIVSDPHDGFILGLANYPTFDLNNFGEAELSAQRNIAITDIYEPGSTFKIVAASGALESRLVTPETLFDCSGDVAMFHGKPVRLPKDDHPHDLMTVADIVIKSSNRGAAHLGMLLGETRLHDYAAAFGFGRRTGLGLGGEVNGVLHPVKDWDGLTITRMPMGHAVAATPMQVHSAMAAIANGGLLMRPQVVRRLEGKEGQRIDYWPDVEGRVVSETTARTMAQLLRRVASNEGTAPRAAIAGFEVAGKTGTTQKIIDGRYSNRHHVGSFVGFFPASDPRLVISVVINDAQLNGTAYGSTVAAPSFQAIAEQLIQYFGIPPTQPAETGTAVAGIPSPYLNSRDRLR